MTLPHDDSEIDGLDPETRARRLRLRREFEAAARARHLKLRRELEAADVNLGVKPIGIPDSVNPDVRFDDRERETGSVAKPHATARLLDSDHDQLAAPNDFEPLPGTPGRGDADADPCCSG